MNFFHRKEKETKEQKTAVFLFLSSFFFVFGFASFYHYAVTDIRAVLAADDTVPPTAPANLISSSVLASQINLSWDASTDDSGEISAYEIYKNGVSVYSVENESAAISTGIVPDTNYEFKVRAVDLAGNQSEFSNNLYVRTPRDMLAPTPASSLVATPTSLSEIHLSWNASSDNVGIARYEVYQDGTKIDSVTNGAVSTVISNLSENTRYSFNVKAFDYSGNESAISETVTATTISSVVVPDAPSNLSAKSVTSSRIELLWASPTNTTSVAGYKIYKNGAEAGTSKINSYSFGGLDPNTSYTFEVTSYNVVGNESPKSNTITVKTPIDITPPTTPSGLTGVAVSFSRINLSWKPALDNNAITGYNVYKNGELITTVPDTKAQITDLAELTTYRFTVQAFDASKNFSPESAAISVKTVVETDTTPPSIPGGLTAKAVSYSKITLAWKGSTDKIGVDGYHVYRGSDRIGTTKGLTFSDTGRTHEKTYSYQVSAYDYAGNVSERSDTVSATTLPLPTGVPVSFKVTVGRPVCKKDGFTYAPVTFSASPYEGGKFKLNGITIEEQSFDPKTIELKNGRYNWEATAKPRHVVTGDSTGDLIIPFLTCAEQKRVIVIPTEPAPTASPSIFGSAAKKGSTEAVLEVFSTYAETDAAIKAEAARDIPASASLSDKLDIIQQIRLGYAFAPQSETVTLGTSLLSRITSPEKTAEKIAGVLANRTPEMAATDPDDDEIPDYDEINIYGTNPKLNDTDADGFTDSEELLAGMDPRDKTASPVTYEDPKKNTVYASTTPDLYTIDKIEAIVSPSIGGAPSKVVGIMFGGKAHPKSYVTLFIFSTQIAATVLSDEEGTWSYIADRELENGKHEIYAALTESDGKILVRSEPVSFTKTNESVYPGSELPPISAEAVVSAAQGFVEKNLLYITIGAVSFLLILIISIAVHIRRKRKAEIEENQIVLRPKI
ncbi:MAG: fibronectin type III domain-containing protein [Candidatus Paceibacterota bacterium]|jgi:chitodextrinase|nr:fibronectin type III domain-containing protein [Candidatus Paceibacterota bacterium]